MAYVFPDTISHLISVRGKASSPVEHRRRGKVRGEIVKEALERLKK